MKMFYIWITMRCYFALLKYCYVCVLHSIFFEVFLEIFPSKCCYCTKYMAFAFAQKLTTRPSKADKGHGSFREAI